MPDLKEAITLCCKQLKLSANLADRAMSQEGRTNQEYLYNLLSNEVVYRKERRITKLLNSAGFPKIYEREQFRTDEIDFPSGVSLDSLLNLEFYRKGENIILYGSTGTGKTMLADYAKSERQFRVNGAAVPFPTAHQRRPLFIDFVTLAHAYSVHSFQDGKNVFCQ